MGEYICHFVFEGEVVKQAYQAEWYYAAMAMHNQFFPRHADQVVKWVSPEGLTIHTHDPSAY